jgi:coenzyme PQQ precursor peptide PqqA
MPGHAEIALIVLDFHPLRRRFRVSRRQPEGTIMAWKKPTVTEIALGAEINSYACADLKR